MSSIFIKKIEKNPLTFGKIQIQVIQINIIYMRLNPIGMTAEKLRNLKPAPPPAPLRKDSVDEQLVETQRFTLNFNPNIGNFWKEKETILNKYRIYEDDAKVQVSHNNDVITYLYNNGSATRMITFKKQDRKLEVCVKDIQDDGKMIIVGCL
jgi:hypothetical protein